VGWSESGGGLNGVTASYLGQQWVAFSNSRSPYRISFGYKRAGCSLIESQDSVSILSVLNPRFYVVTRDPTANDPSALALCPPEALPGRLQVLSILDMILRDGIWYVIVRVEASISLGEVQHNSLIRSCVVRDLSTKRWPGLE
jgi:hypothetical protein